MKTYRAVDAYIHVFLTSAVDGVGSFTPRGLYPRGKRDPGTHWIEGWVDLRKGLDYVRSRNLALTGPRTPIRRPFTP
jgi:hypothetical protein